MACPKFRKLPFMCQPLFVPEDTELLQPVMFGKAFWRVWRLPVARPPWFPRCSLPRRLGSWWTRGGAWGLTQHWAPGLLASPVPSDPLCTLRLLRAGGSCCQQRVVGRSSWNEYLWATPILILSIRGKYILNTGRTIGSAPSLSIYNLLCSFWNPLVWSTVNTLGEKHWICRRSLLNALQHGKPVTYVNGFLVFAQIALQAQLNRFAIQLKPDLWHSLKWWGSSSPL